MVNIQLEYCLNNVTDPVLNAKTTEDLGGKTKYFKGKFLKYIWKIQRVL